MPSYAPVFTRYAPFILMCYQCEGIYLLGVPQSPQTGQAVQGYYITAYRNLTTVSLTTYSCEV
jgi:hypothetical protein